MSQSPHVSLVNAIVAGNADTSAVSPRPIGKVVCVGRNYAAHARELGNDVPTMPILFMKPASSVVHISHNHSSADNVIVRPDTAKYGETHYEAELCVQLATELNHATREEAEQAIGAVTLGLDLTLRELQSVLKDKGHPWERAKCFDGACVLADWVSPEAFGDFSQVRYQLSINDTLKQDGDSALMLFPLYDLLVEISHAFCLQAGDVIMTGTPSGVGVLHAGDRLTLTLGEQAWQATVV